jgi:predicted permease
VGGAVLGLGFAYAIVYYLAHQGSITLPLLTTIRVDAAAMGWTLLIALAVGVLFGLAPAFKMSGGNLQDALKDNAAGMAAGRSQQRFRGALVVSEIALACVLLVGAGLLLRSFLRVLDIDLGFQPSHAATMNIDLPPAGNADEFARRVVSFRTTLDKIEALPGVESAGITDMLPLDRNRSWGLQSVGRVHAKDADTSALVYVVSPNYLPTMGMHLVAGRDFTWNDTAADSQHVVIINEATARREWPGEDPIGKLANCYDKNPVRVIGVMADVHESSLEQASNPEVYIPATQVGDMEGATLVVRTKMDPEKLSSSVLATLRSLNPGQPATEFRSLQALVDHSVSPRRFFVLLVTVFAALGVMLAALGIYGVISYSVTQKTQEIGVRMALGASTGRVQRDVLAGTLKLVLIGIFLGTAISLDAARIIASLLFAISPWDPMTYVFMGLGLIAVALLSGYLPALRASRIDPMIALRSN